MSSYINFKDVHKIYQMGDTEVHAANGIDFDIEQGEFVIIVGPSGAGKSTVLNILGGMDTATKGEITVDGERVDLYDRQELIMYRRHDVGFVFQFYNLMQNLTALENVELATQITNNQLDPFEVLKGVGLEDRKDNFPSQLSGGEQQRVSIARALAKKPKLLLCDEPTGALDYATGKEVLKLLQDTSKEEGITVIVITHNQAITPMADRIIKIRNGKVEESYMNDNIVSVMEIEW